MDIDGPILGEAPFLRDVLRDNCPQQLLLPVALFRHDHLQILDQLFPPEAADRLKHLILFFELNIKQRHQPSGQRCNFSWDEFMVRAFGRAFILTTDADVHVPRAGTLGCSSRLNETPQQPDPPPHRPPLQY